MIRRPLYLAGSVVAVVALVAVWGWYASGESPAVMPTPARTWDALVAMARDGSLVRELATTLGRAALATVISVVLGVVLGAGAARSVFVDGLLAPVRAVLQGLPPIVAIVILVLLLGSDPAITVVVTTTVMIPLIAGATTGALRGIDPGLTELGAGLALSRVRRIALITVPAAAPAVLAAGGAVASGAVRVTVMAELLSAPNGVGAAMAQNRTLLQTPQLYAWTIAVIGSALLVDLLVQFVVRRWSAVFAPASAATRSRPGS